MEGMSVQRLVNASDSDTVFAKTWMWTKARLGEFYKMWLVHARILESVFA